MANWLGNDGPPTAREVGVARILPLRHRVLRPGLPADSANFDGDAEPPTIHLAAIDGGGAVVGCLSLVRRPWVVDGAAEPAWQLRGMAVDAAWRSAGVGRLLLAHADERIFQATRQDGFTGLVWCNARSPAVGFYARHGWETVGPEFEIPTAGPHHRMLKRIEPT